MTLNNIIHGDVLESLKEIDSDYFDLCITSPPYNKKSVGGDIIKKVEYDTFDDNLPEDVYQDQQIEILNELYRTMKPGGSMFYNHKCRWQNGRMIHPIMWLTKTDWILKQEIVWNRKITANLRGWRFWQVDERIHWLYKPNGKDFIGPELKSHHAKMTSIWDIMPESKNSHPAPFPIEIPSRIIYSLFNDDRDKIVIDPYMGSGTTAIACKLFGCNYVGIDISKKYIDMANERINNYELFRDKYNNECDRHKVVGMTYKERKARKIAKNI